MPIREVNYYFIT